MYQLFRIVLKLYCLCARVRVQVVCAQTSVLRSRLGLTCEAGAVQQNTKKNRYKDVLPCKNTHSCLRSVPSTSEGHVTSSR